VGFVSLTFVTSFEVVGDISSHPRPVVALLDTMIRAFYAVMAGRWGVVILFKDSRSLMIGNEKLGGFFVIILGVAIQHTAVQEASSVEPGPRYFRGCIR
jgi:hypothetical protein